VGVNDLCYLTTEQPGIEPPSLMSLWYDELRLIFVAFIRFVSSGISAVRTNRVCIFVHELTNE